MYESEGYKNGVSISIEGEKERSQKKVPFYRYSSSGVKRR